MEALKALVEKVVEETGYFLYELTLGPKEGVLTLCVDIEGRGYLSIDDVVKVNQALSLALDEDDTIEESYQLEVGSADPERELKTHAQRERAVGRWVLVKTHDQTLEGGLETVTADSITLTTKKKQTHTFHLADVTLLRLAIHF
jgi:ribosome maturation factor RimP